MSTITLYSYHDETQIEENATAKENDSTVDVHSTAFNGAECNSVNYKDVTPFENIGSLDS